MKKTYAYLSAALVMVASLSSCSRSDYAFKPGNSPYHSHALVEQVPTVVAPTATAELPAEPELTASAEVIPSATYRRTVPKVVTPHSLTAKVEKGVAPQQASIDKASETKAMRKMVKAARNNVKATTANGGKSQLTALLLNIFLGGLGIHRFYLGYTGRGILYIGLLLTSFLIVPAIALLILSIIDLVNIATGKLKPKNGEYAKKFNDQ